MINRNIELSVKQRLLVVERIVVKGEFFLNSELAKKTFDEEH